MVMVVTSQVDSSSFLVLPLPPLMALVLVTPLVSQLLVSQPLVSQPLVSLILVVQSLASLILALVTLTLVLILVLIPSFLILVMGMLLCKFLVFQNATIYEDSTYLNYGKSVIVVNHLITEGYCFLLFSSINIMKNGESLPTKTISAIVKCSFTKYVDDLK